MKKPALLILSLCIPFILRAQECGRIITFNAADKSGFTTSCGSITEQAWRVSRNSCNFYTPLTSLPELENGTGSWVDIRARFTGGGNLDEKDFIWLFYFVDGKTVSTKTIKRQETESVFFVKDSLFVHSGGNFRVRIVFVCDGADEFWQLESGDLTLCIRNYGEVQEAEQPEPTQNPSGRFSGSIVRLDWLAETSSDSNYFLVERSKNGKQYEFAGYVKCAPGRDSMSYSFIDTNPFSPLTWYRVSRVNFSNPPEPVGIPFLVSNESSSSK